MRRLGIGLVLVVLLASCSAMPGASGNQRGKAIDGLSPAEFSPGIMAIGQDKDLDYARAEGLGIVPAATFQKYLNSILARLLAASPVRGVPARVYLRATADWGAKTTADANIFVSLGTALRLDNEDEAASLLAHEASHAILNHTSSDALRSTQERVIQVSLLALAIRDAIKDKPQTSASGDDAHLKEQAAALLLNTLVLSPTWNRGQERDADRLGADLMVRAGYDPQAALSLLRKQQEMEAGQASDPTADALANLLTGLGDKQIGEVDAEIQARSAEAERAKTVVRGGVRTATNWIVQQVKRVASDHPTATSRLTDLEAYVAREYPAAATAGLQSKTWEAAKNTRATAEILGNYMDAIDANRQLVAGDVDAAAKSSRASLKGATKRHAYPAYVFAAVKLAQGKSSEAMASYEAALSGPEPAGQIFVSVSAEYMKAGKKDKGLNVLLDGYRRLQEPPALVVPLIQTYRALGKKDEADGLVSICALRWPSLASACGSETTEDSSTERRS